MKRTFILLFFFAVIGIADAQTPNWAWAKGATGRSNDEAGNICSDAFGNVYIAGNFESNFIVFGSDTLYKKDTIDDTYDIFIAKLDANGNYLWAKSAGGNDYNGNSAIAIDENNNVYVTGYFYSKTIIFDSDTLYNVDTTSGNISNIYFVKLNTNGNVLWAKCLGDTNSNVSCSLALDKKNNIYMSGGYYSQKFYFGNDTLNNMQAGSTDVFLLKFDSIGNPVWAKNFGSKSQDWGTSITTDTTGNIYMTGYFYGYKFIAGSDTLYLTDTSWLYQPSDMFILKLDTLGNVIWAKHQSGGDEGIWTENIALDKNDNIYVSGSFIGDTIIMGNDTLFNASHSYPNSNEPDVFIAKYDNNGNEKWAKRDGGVELDECTSMFVDGNFNIYIGGFFDNAYIVFGSDTLFNLSSTGASDLFIVKYDTFGNVIWAKSSGGNRNECITSITEDNFGNISVSGYFDGSSMNFGTIVLNNSMTDWTDDIFVANLSYLTGISETSKNDDFIIYPNPAINNLTIDIAATLNIRATIEITNIQGQLLKTLATTGKKTTVDVSALANGMYFVKVKTEKGVAVKKFIKE